MKKIMKRSRMIVIMALFLSVWMGMTAPAKTIKTNVTRFMLKNGKLVESSRDAYFSLTEGGISHVSKAKSSNTKVATVRAKDAFATIRFKKPGKAVISLTATRFNQPGVKYIFNVNVLRYTNPFKVLKVGENSIAAAFDKKMFSEMPLNGKSGQLEFALRKGWKLKRVNLYPDGDTEEPLKVYNNSQIAFTGEGGELEFELQNTKVKEKFIFRINDN